MNKILALILLVCMIPFHADAQEQFRNYDELKSSLTSKVRAYMNANPTHTVDSLRRSVIDGLCTGAVAKSDVLSKASKKKLTSRQVFEKCKRSSLLFGNMEHSDAWKADTAYITASAVALTRDGLCATNYHVVSDVVLSGALHHYKKGDLMRFLVDYDGNIYPLERVLYVDPINDLALIKVDPCGRELVPAALGDDAVQGDKVYCLSHPSGYGWHFTDGMVSNCVSKINPQNGQSLYDLEITSDYGVGASGGPIFDECGNLVALVSSTFSLYAQPQQFRNFQMSFKMTVPVFLIKNCFTD